MTHLPVSWKRLRQAQLALLLMLVTVATAAPPRPFAGGSDVIVAPDGRDDNAGTCASPLSLARALSGKSRVQEGDRLWLRGGTYEGAFTSRIRGTEWAPVEIRGYPGERAVIDNRGTARDAVTVLGGWTRWHDIEITNSDPQRLSQVRGPWPDDLARGFGMFVVGRNVELSNLVIHDLGNGLGLWEEAVDSSAFSNLIYYNGWQGPDRAHGHGIYSQNRRGKRIIQGNIIFGQFSHGIHAYGSARVALNHMHLRENVLFNNGALGADGFARDILVGGGQPVRDLQVTDNNTYGGAQTALGYGLGCIDARLTGNYLVGAPPLVLHRCAPEMYENTLVGDVSALDDRDAGSNRFLPNRPDGVQVRVVPDRKRRGGAHVVVYNWDRRRSVSVDLSATSLEPGDTFEIRDAQNYFGPHRRTMTYAGTPITLSLQSRPPGRPVGTVPGRAIGTGPDFSVFVIVPVGNLPAPTLPCEASENVP
jgi:hypothetical protein